MRQKVVVVGAGNVGATTAQRIAEKELADVVLIDVIEGIPMGKALDLSESGPLEGFDANISGSMSIDAAKDADLVVITAGLPRKPGTSRDDLLKTNGEIMKSIVEKVATLAPDSILIIVSNPLDAMCQIALNTSGFPKNRIIGMAGVLDSARFKTFIAWELGVSMEDVQALTLGGHGDTMVPLPRYATVSGIPITQLISEDRINELADRTRNGGGEVLGYLKAGGAYYAPSSAVVEMVESIIRDKKRILPCSVYLEGEFGLNGVFLGVPVKLGSAGCEDVIQLYLNEEEMSALHDSAAAVRKLIEKLPQLGLS